MVVTCRVTILPVCVCVCVPPPSVFPTELVDLPVFSTSVNIDSLKITAAQPSLLTFALLSLKQNIGFIDLFQTFFCFLKRFIK